MQDDKIFDLMAKMYTEMQQGFKKIDERFTGVDGQIDGIDKKMDGLEKRMNGLEEKVANNSVMFEKRGKDIQLLVEGQKNLSEQMDRKFAEVNKTIEDNYTLHDRAIKNISKTSVKGEKAYDFIKELSSKNFDD